jgi:hypothetical protein
VSNDLADPSSTSTTTSSSSSTQRHLIYSILIGLATLAILLQGVWAGIFLSYDKRPDKWINVHARGAEVAIALVALALVAAIAKLRSRTDLLIGTGLLLVLLLLEGYLGGQVTDGGKDKLTIVHVPLGMVIMGLAVWLPLRSRQGRVS